MTSKHLLFAVMATIWGLTWIAIKIGVEASPPFAFAGARLVAAGSILLVAARIRGTALSLSGSRGRIVVVALLVNTVAYGLLFWGMQYVPSGLSSVINLSLIPIGLFTLGLAAGEETYSRRKVTGISLGVLGLVVLFLPRLDFEADVFEITGMAAIVVGTLAYCWGSILGRPLLKILTPLALSGWLTFIGGAGLLLLAAAFEPLNAQLLSRIFTIRVIASWLFLVLGGSIVAFTVYLALLKDWGPARAGLYAFVSPIIAVALGVIVFAEPFGVHEIVGSILMLSAAALAMRPAPGPSPVPAPQLSAAGKPRG